MKFFFLANGGAFSDLSTSPSSISGATSLYSKVIGGRPMMHQIAGQNNSGYAFQPALFSGKVSFYTVTGNGTNNATIGLNAVAITAPTAVNVGTATLFQSVRRVNYPSSAATAGSSGGVRQNVPQWFRGDSDGKGGFFMVVQAGMSHAAPVANSRGFIGMYGSVNAIGNVDPSSLTNILGFGFDAGEQSWSFMHNDGSGTAVKVSLGEGFPSQTANEDWYQFTIACPSNSNTVYYHIVNKTTGVEAYGEVDADLPAVNQLLAYQLWHNNGATALATQMAVSTIYIETEN